MKKTLLALATLALCCTLSAPASAATFGAYGSYWDSKDMKSTTGFGVKFGFDLSKNVELEFHGTYYKDFEETFSGTGFKLTALPVGGGLRFNLMPEETFNFALGVGVSYVFLDSNIGTIDDKLMWYGLAGFDVGSKTTRFMLEAVYRKLKSTLDNGGIGLDVKLDGFSVNAGVLWKF
jgi:outer membrane protein with beta-barrel domain